MQHELSKLKSLIENFRFSLESESSINDHVGDLSDVRNFFYKNGLEIDTNNTKIIGDAFEEVKSFLRIPPETIKAFVFASPELQAECYLGPKDECVLRISSSLIKLLNKEEMKFVIGHEIGHFLLDHRGTVFNETSINTQAREISADRVGLLCVDSVNDAIRAILKTVSGLNEDYLTFNIKNYIDQMKKVLESPSLLNHDSTHPSMLLRTRALLWFSMSGSKEIFPQLISAQKLQDLDRKVIKDFNREREHLISQEISASKRQLLFWSIAEKIFNKGSFKKTDQEKVNNLLSEEDAKKLINFFNSNTPNDIQSIINRNTSSIKNDLERVIGGNKFSEVNKELQNLLLDNF